MTEENSKQNPWGDFVDELTGDAKVKAARRVMLVDDSSVVRNELRHFLAVRDCEIVEAVDGVDALAKLKEQPNIHLMFLDINMPNMDGLELAEKLAAQVAAGELRQFAIVMLTTESTKDKVVRAKKAGVLGWIIKPPKKEHILQLFDRFVGGAKAAA